MSRFANAQLLIKDVESHLIGEEQSAWKAVTFLQYNVWFPMRFLLLGVGDKFVAVTTWAFFAFTGMFLWMLVVPRIGLAGILIGDNVMLALMALSLVPAVFAMPSVYGNGQIASDDVMFVTARLPMIGATSNKEIEFLQQTIRIVEEKCRTRVKALKWIVGGVWALLIYAYNKAESANINTIDETKTAVIQILGLGGGVIVGYFLVWGYEAALDKLFRTIEFGCNESKTADAI
jgi:hypothetical protein